MYTKNERLMRDIEKANNRDLGQFHVFFSPEGAPQVGPVYHGTYNSREVAEVIAGRQQNGEVYNMDGKRLWSNL